MKIRSSRQLVGFACLIGLLPILLTNCSNSSDKSESATETNASAPTSVGSAPPPPVSVDTVAVMPTPAPMEADSSSSGPPPSVSEETDGSSSGPPPPPPPRETAGWHEPQKPAVATDGKVVFDWPSQMKIDETYLIHLAIACNVPLRYLQEQVDSLAVVDADTAGQHRRRRSKTQIKLGRNMKATLMGASATDSNVTIARPPDDDGNRTLDLQTDTSVVWSWNVTPHKAGPMKLTMYLTRVDERDSRPVDVQTIRVEGIQPGFFDRLTDALTKLNALWVLLSTGVAGALVKYLRDQRAKHNKPESAAPPGPDR